MFSKFDQCADLLSGEHLFQVARSVHVEDDDPETVFAAT